MREGLDESATAISTAVSNHDFGLEVRQLMAINLPRQVELLQAACRRLALHPDEEPARQDALRTIAIAPLVAGPDDTTFVRALLDEARSDAERLAFRLEGPGCDRLAVCALTAALARSLAELRARLQMREAAPPR